LKEEITRPVNMDEALNGAEDGNLIMVVNFELNKKLVEYMASWNVNSDAIMKKPSNGVVLLVSIFFRFWRPGLITSFIALVMRIVELKLDYWLPMAISM
jgi:hypothetical protein